MARPFTPDRFTRRQAAQNAAFLAALRRTGNAREAASTLGYNRSTFTKRRAAHPAFAAKWNGSNPATLVTDWTDQIGYTSDRSPG